MKPTDEQWNRWIDGHLSAEEEAKLSAYAKKTGEFADDRDFFQQLSRDLRRTYPKEQHPPYPDFFASQIQKRIRIAASESVETRMNVGRVWLRWLVPGALAAALAVSAALQFGLFERNSSGRNRIISIYTPDESVSAVASYHPEADVTVVRMTGIEPLPADFHLTAGTVADAGPGAYRGEAKASPDLSAAANPADREGPRSLPIRFTSHRRVH